MGKVINSTRCKRFNEINANNNSKIKPKEVKHNGVRIKKLFKSRCPFLQKIQHFFESILFPAAKNNYWHRKVKVVKQIEKELAPHTPRNPPIPVKNEEEILTSPSIPVSKAVFYPHLLKYHQVNNLKLAASLLLTSLGATHWDDKVFQLKNGAAIYLGALPLKPGTLRWQDGQIYKELKSKGIKGILTVTESFENHILGYMHSAITPADWRKRGFNQLQISVVDHETMTLDEMEEGVAYIESHVNEGQSIYVHCMAGKSRSFLMVMGYLMKNEGMTSAEAYRFIKQRRIQSGFSSDSPKWQTAFEFEKKHRKGILTLK